VIRDFRMEDTEQIIELIKKERSWNGSIRLKY
jgi:hypothetical protein